MPIMDIIHVHITRTYVQKLFNSKYNSKIVTN